LQIRTFWIGLLYGLTAIGRERSVDRDQRKLIVWPVIGEQ